MKKSKLLFLFLVIINLPVIGQVSESRFHFQTTRDSSRIQVSDGLLVVPWTPKMNFTTKAENENFFKLFFRSETFENLEIVRMDSSELTVRFTDLTGVEFYFDEIKELYKARPNYNHLATFSNKEEDVIYFPNRFNILYGIIEAIDIKDLWKPIQFCYNYGWGDHMEELWLNPGQTLLIPINSNFGSTSTRMRLKLHGNDTIYISNEFIGTIDETSFHVPEIIYDRSEHLDPFLNEIIFRNIEEEEEYDFTEMKD